MLATSIVVLIIAQPPDSPVSAAFERAARGVLGEDARVRVAAVEADPPDEESAALGRDVDAVVELSWSDADGRARVHVFLSREGRWVDREISFGSASDGSARDARERGRLLGFATAGMLTEVDNPKPAPEKPRAVTAAEAPKTSNDEPRARQELVQPPRTLEFSGIVSSGLAGTASGVGALAGFRLRLSERWWWARAFVAGRSGSIPVAQSATRAVLFGGGAALSLLPPSSRWALGVRCDAFASYFQASHLSEDDIVPDQQSRWLPGMDLVPEVGFHFADSAGVFAGAGIEAIFGKTDIYTHGERVAVVPALRAVGEIGFRAGF